jgi:hypothetical protein
MTEVVTSGSMSGESKRNDGLLGESDHERRRLLQAPPVLNATALLLDSTEPVSCYGEVPPVPENCKPSVIRLQIFRASARCGARERQY